MPWVSAASIAAFAHAMQHRTCPQGQKAIVRLALGAAPGDP